MQKLKSFIVKKIEIVVSVLALLFITVLVAFLDKTGLFIVCFLTFIAFFVYAAYYYVVKFKFFAAVESENLLDFTVDSLTNLSSPMLMINTKDEIVWYNAAFEPIKKAIGLNNGQSVKGLVKDALCYDSMYGKKDVLRIRAEDKRYEVESVGFKLKGNVCLLSFWKDVTKQYNAEDMLKKRNLVVGYVAVDNADDVASYLQSQYRASIAVAYKELYDWVNGMHGVIREYDRDKYIVFVDEENFLPNFDKKFEILNAIETALTNSEVRLTFSMGFAHVDGTLAEKEANAREALDHAFQRGGAQVVVKTHNASKSFGGQSRAGVKTSKIKSRQTAEKLKALMAECENVIVMGHKRIDVDAFASACAVARFAMLQGKKVNIVINKNDDDLENFMPFLGELHEYDNVFVDGSRGQELLTPKTLVVIVDVNNPAIFESVDIYKNAANLVIIDHHVKNDKDETFEIPVALQYIDPSASSASELMCEIIESVSSRGGGLKGPEKELLFAGVLLDTQRFTRGTGVRTFGALMFLRPDHEMMLRARSVLKPNLDEYIRLSKFQKTAEVYLDIVGMSHFDGDNIEGNKIYASMAAEDLLEIEGVKASFALATMGEGVYVSARSDGSMKVNTIAEAIGGGGRFDAAAAFLPNVTIEQAKNKIKETINSVWFDKDTTGGTEQ